ncbi:FkbM family methyltransferase [Spongiactinospora sp. TRM90649]|uniref:FkbM family methyltransferase n=1 Tax=Spongiactinospora sp. TRM90649 TaxID=3031114 RepID=UPI0023F91A27|nr:FkbM family methyltransferase [Spongiactinospora sp. TRM90649]MDF5758140.1 FkbM family methyltransferase [Spongiactinospora sp. TRM90649]
MPIRNLRRGLAISLMRAARAANRARVVRVVLRGRSVRRFPVVNTIYHAVFRAGVTGERASEVTATYRGVTLTGPAWDRTIMPSVAGGYYEEFEVGLFERLAAGSGTILDVGANIGVYACTGASHLPEGGRLVAFEPVPENLGYLRANIDRNGLGDRVTVEPAAVGAAPGELTLHLSGEQSGKHSASAVNAGEATGSVSVPMTSIDAYLAEGGLRPDIIKIDVEGYEGFVLRGAAETLAGLPTLLFEVHPELQANCGCPAPELLDQVFARYEWVFVVDELNNRLLPHTRAQLDEPDAIGLYRSNLVAVGRREHLDALAEWHGVRP